MELSTAFAVSLSVIGSAVVALAWWFSSWKAGVDKDVREMHDTLMKINGTLERIDERLSTLIGIPDRVAVAENHLAAAERTAGDASRRIGVLESQVQSGLIKDARMSAQIDSLYDKMVGKSTPSTRTARDKENK